MVMSNCLLLLPLRNKANNYFKTSLHDVYWPSSFLRASLFYSFVLPIWTTISLQKRIRTACITLRNVLTPEFSPWCPEDLINSFSKISRGDKILAAMEIRNRTLCHGREGGITIKLQSIRVV